MPLETIDITKLKPLDWKFWLSVFVVVIIGALVVAGGLWASAKIKGWISPAQEPVI